MSLAQDHRDTKWQSQAPTQAGYNLPLDSASRDVINDPMTTTAIYFERCCKLS